MEKKNSSTSTIFALVNNMVGGAMLTFPVLYRNTGIVTSSIILVISGLISFVTCRIYVFHMAPKDNDVQDMIRRILGIKWQTFFRFITGFHLLLISIIYIDLIVDQTYSIILFILYHTGHSDWIADQNQFVFDKFSVQYLTLLYVIPLLLLISIKNLNVLIKLAEYGVYSVFFYFAFIVYQFGSNIIDGEINIDHINWFSWDVGRLAGGSALAFTIHTMVVTILKPNRYQEKNLRDVGLSYLLGFFLYELIGVMGAFAISDIDCEQTLLRCYKNSWQALLVQVFYLYGRATVYPCTVEIGRTRLLNYFFPKITQKNFRIFNVLFIIVASIFSFLSPFIPITLLMNLVGAIVCYFFIYAIPILIHYRCLYTTVRADESLLDSFTSIEWDGRGVAADCQHSRDYVRNRPKWIRFVFYGIINLIGVAIGIYGLYVCFN